MGVSTDAIIAYGVELPEDQMDNIDNIVGGEEEEKLNEQGLAIVYHCSDEYPMAILAVKDTVIRAWRGSPVEIRREDLHRPLGVNWDQRLDDALVDLDIEMDPDYEPMWLLFSWWG